MIGKRIGKDRIYIHLSAAAHLPPHLFERFRKACKIYDDALQSGKVKYTFSCNFIITHPDYIEFVKAEDFDTAWEPVLGERNRVYDDGRIVNIPRPAKPRVLHQRYKTVRQDHYKGFSIQADKNREKWYRKYFDARKMAGAGYLHKWQEMLKEIDFGT
jgi:hypothetical protein